jgi:hypothetical protein
MDFFEKIKPGVLCKDSIGLFIVIKILSIVDYRIEFVIYDCRSNYITSTASNFALDGYASTFKILADAYL